jgi:N-acetylglucosamine kinase-like BadF-type ATPase
MPQYFIAIDGGSTTSAGLLARHDLQILHRASAGCANYHLIGARGTERTLLTLIESLCSAGGLSSKQIEGFCFALSGVSRPEDFNTIEAILRRHLIQQRSKIVPDFEAALLGGTSKGVGMVVISGTGSVIFAKNKRGETKKVGGHGHLAGDPGSAYDIGIRGLRAIIAASEGRIGETLLRERILQAASIRSVDDIVPWLHGSDTPKVAVASLAPQIISAAEHKDPVARDILRSAAAELTDLAAFTANSLQLDREPFDIVLSGGVFQNNPEYFRLMKSLLSETMAMANPTEPENEPAFGALVALRGRPAPQPTGESTNRAAASGQAGSSPSLSPGR